MAVAAAGIYLAFDGGPDGSKAEDAGIGPYDEIVLRGARAIGERGGLGKVIALRSAAGSWRDAESSSSESDHKGAIGRGDLRLSAGGALLIVRFADDEVAGQMAVPDLGPFAGVLVGTHEVRGDDQTLAVRVSRISPWQLTDRAGASFQGAIREALVFVATGYSAVNHPRQGVKISEPARLQPEPPTVDAPQMPMSFAPEEDAPRCVWLDRVKTAPRITLRMAPPRLSTSVKTPAASSVGLRLPGPVRSHRTSAIATATPSSCGQSAIT